MPTDPGREAAIKEIVRSAIADSLDRHLNAVSDKTRLIVIEELRGHWANETADRVRTLVNERGLQWWETAKPLVIQEVENTAGKKLISYTQDERDRRLRTLGLPIVGALVGLVLAVGAGINWAVRQEVKSQIAAKVEAVTTAAAEKVKTDTDAFRVEAERAKNAAVLAETNYRTIEKDFISLRDAAKSDADKWRLTSSRMEDVEKESKILVELSKAQADRIAGTEKAIAGAIAERPDEIQKQLESAVLPVGTIIGIPESRLLLFLDAGKLQWLHPTRYDPTEARWTLADGRVVDGSRWAKIFDTRKPGSTDEIRVPDLNGVVASWPKAIGDGNAAPSGTNDAGAAKVAPKPIPQSGEKIILLIKINP